MRSIPLQHLDLCSDGLALFDCQSGALLWSNPAFLSITESATSDQTATQGEAAQRILDLVLQALGGLPLEPSPPHIEGAWQERRVFLKALNEEQLGVWLLVIHGANVQSQPLAEPLSATGDALTGLPDRRSLELELARRFATCPVVPFALLFVDLNRFKQVNDSQGHLAGDRTLRVVAQRLQSALRDGDLVARFGGDEFIVVVDAIESRTSLEPIVRRLEESLDAPLARADNLTVSASIGAAFSSDGHQSPNEMIEAADRDMYARKSLAD